MVETIQDGGDFHLALINHSIVWEDGFIKPPTAPGLRIEVNEKLARAHPFEGTHLHLEMQDDPCNYAEENDFKGGGSSN